MLDYMTTAFMVGTSALSRVQLESFDNALASWRAEGCTVISKMMQIPHSDSEVQTFAFEAVCAGRRGVRETREHRELAVKQKVDRLAFLGRMDDTYLYAPHADLEHPFSEPLYWRILTIADVNRLITDLGLVIRGRMSRAEFLKSNPPSGGHGSPLDFEGYVLLRKMLIGYDYSKLKTVEYYVAHSSKSNIDALLEIAEYAGDAFPNALEAANMLKPGALAARLTIVSDLVDAAIDFSDGSDLMKALPDDVIIQLGDRTRDIKCRIAMNCKGFSLAEQFVPTFIAQFPALGRAKDPEGIVHGLVMYILPWNADRDARIRDLDSSHRAVKDLLAACIKH